MARPEVEIPKAPSGIFPFHIPATGIVPGFGRGSAALGFPTANICVDSHECLKSLETGVYFGWARVTVPECRGAIHNEDRVDGKSSVEVNFGLNLDPSEINVIHPMVMSIGWNPFFHNETKTCEVYIIHEFKERFYGANLEAAVCGYIRPQLDYEGIEALKKDIGIDVAIGLEYLSLDAYAKCRDLFSQ